MRIFFIIIYVLFLGFQNINAGKIKHSQLLSLQKENKPFKTKNEEINVFSHQEKQVVKNFNPNSNSNKIKIQRKKLIDSLKASINYLNNIYKIIQPIAKKYWDKADGNLIASELAVLGGDLETTKTFINNCIIFLTICIDSLASFSAEDMADWINKINTHLMDLNQRNILSINIENHSEQVQKNAKKLQALL